MTPTERNNKTLASWLNLFNGEPCYILGNGPSLDVESLDKIDALTIGINRFYPPYSSYQPTALIYQDERIRNEIDKLQRDKAIRLDSIEIGLASMSRPRFDEDRTIVRVTSIPTRQTDDPAKRHPMPTNFAAIYRGHSHAMAFQVAYLLGSDPVIFCGVDCSFDDPREKTNYYGGRPAGAAYTARTLPNCKRASEWAVANASGRTIINCGDDCRLGPRRDLKDVVEIYKGKGNYRERLLFED
jgi:hypothetical protein